MKRPNLNWNAILVVGLLLMFVILTAYSASQQQPADTPQPDGSTYGNQPQGTRALKLWLDSLGYRTVTLEGDHFLPDQTIDVLFLLSPSYTLNQSEATIITDWVNEGGTLILAGDNPFAAGALWKEFGLEIEWLDHSVERLSAVQPLLDTPPVREANVQAGAAWKLTRSDYVAHLMAKDKPVLISWRQGRGQVFAITTLEPFTNAGLKDEGDAALVYNLVLASVEQRGVVAFDEYHHGFRSAPSLRTWLMSTRMGWSILYSLVMVFAFLLIGGKRFGVSVPLPEHVARRTTAEYIQALGNLYRRAGRRQAILAHYKDRLKRNLGRTYRIDPNLPDRPFVLELSAYRPELDKERLLRLLANLSRKQVSERDMVRVAEEAVKFQI